jgi:hypothetical protein
MRNEEKYRFSDFTTKNYRLLLKMARSKYPFETFDSFSGKDRFVIWRHDVDFSPQRALKLAIIEKEEGVQATYFILLHSEFYNTFEKEVSLKIAEIIALGHKIGLHFDTHYYGIKNETELETKLLWEKKIIEELFNTEVSVFSFHVTNQFTKSCKSDSYAGMMNVYSDRIESELSYCSDSNGYWRFNRLEDVLLEAAPNKLQVLTHPELWQDEIMSPRQRVWRCIDGRAENTRKWYNETLQSYGRDNVDW